MKIEESKGKAVPSGASRKRRKLYANVRGKADTEVKKLEDSGVDLIIHYQDHA